MGRLAKHRIASILILQRELDNPEIQNPYSDEIIELYEAGHKGNDIVASAKIAEFCINGMGREKSANQAIQIYEDILQRSPSYAEESTYARVALTMAMRNFLGLYTPKDNKKANEYLDKISDNSNHSDIRYGLQEWKKTYSVLY